MATLAGAFGAPTRRPDLLSGTPRAGFIDRWIYVFTAASFIVITLTGFIPDSVMKVTLIEAGRETAVSDRAAFPRGPDGFFPASAAGADVVATGHCALHRRVGIAAFALVPALVLVGFILVPTMYHQAWYAVQTAPPEARAALREFLPVLDKILLMQLRVGVLFPLFIILALRARENDPGFHKRMMILAVAPALGAAIDRITWLPTDFPGSPMASDLYVLLAISPMFLWDAIRNRRIHQTYWVWLGVALPFTIAVHALWGTAWWEATAPRLMGV